MKTKRYKLNSKGFSHIEIILALVVVVAIAGVGIFVYKHHQDSKKAMASAGTFVSKPVIGSSVKGSSVSVNGKSLGSIVPSASALNLSHIATAGFGWDIYACRTTAKYGNVPVYSIQGFFWKPSQVSAQAVLQERTQNNWLAPTVQYLTSSTYYLNRVTEITMNVDALNSNYYIQFGEAPTNQAQVLYNTFTVAGIGGYLVSC
jgi:hypothetical protein